MSKKTTGTYEWANKTFNLQFGCENNCTYCYAKRMANRFGRIPFLGWNHPIMKPLPEIPKNSLVMFPSTHDITPNNLSLSIKCINHLLSKNNRILIVSKPRLDCIAQITSNEEIIKRKDRIEFRFTIGCWFENDYIRKIWEPDASPITERYDCVRLALDREFKVSISIEPLLETNLIDFGEMIADFEYHHVSEIWIGAMNYSKEIPNLDFKAVYNIAKESPIVKFKESFRKHLPEIFQKKGDRIC